MKKTAKRKILACDNIQGALPVLLDVSVVRNAEIAVSAEAEQVVVSAFELTAVDVSETVPL